MPDREKVIKTLTDALTAKENYPWAKAEMSFEFIEMLLELLKEQEAVVWCRDCKYWAVGDFGPFCPYHYDARPDWYCADGERRTK